MPRAVEWYFDFISPYSYLQTARFDDLPDDVDVTLRPVLFAGLLKHWEHKGPAEVIPKRLFAYRHVHWLGRHMNVPFRMTPAHPFNPLKALRLAVALGCERETVLAIFRAIWRDGHLPDDPKGWQHIGAAAGVDNPDQAIRAHGVKESLQANMTRAIAADVFGVPTFVYNGVAFWGLDATDFLLEALRDPDLLRDPEFRRIETLPVGTQRTAVHAS